ncbi:MAG: metallophosphoesterase [candidate division WOR-3 bacterium]|nr:metallophosphoesterase [candidate division WOR-3 bacterium]
MNDYVIGVISDTHDNLTNVTKAITIFNQNQVKLVIHCGDYVAPFTLRMFKDLNCPLIGVLGNCDGEVEYLLKTAFELNFSIYHPPYTLTINNRKLIITHKPIRIDQPCDIYLYGHTHTPEISMRNNQLIVNPGEACGWLFYKPSIALINLNEFSGEIINL